MAKIIFFGTHDFGAAMLAALIDHGHEITLAVTQPDRPVGRKQELSASPVKQLAFQKGLNVVQPETLKNFEIDHSPDLIVVCQYGLIIPERILKIGKNGALNVHTSLLPKYRGASPIQSAIVNGETETGITIMLMDEKMDHGPILSQVKVSIGPDDIYPELRKKMAPLAGKLLCETIEKWLNDEIKPQTQNENKVTFCKIFNRDDGRIDWSKDPKNIYDLFRGLTPWPGIWTTWQGKRLKLLNIKISDKRSEKGTAMINGGRLIVGAGNGAIEILEIQLEGKNAMSAGSFISGYTSIDGAKLS